MDKFEQETDRLHDLSDGKVSSPRAGPAPKSNDILALLSRLEALFEEYRIWHMSRKYHTAMNGVTNWNSKLEGIRAREDLQSMSALFHEVSG